MQRIIIDTDAGVDDALAILYLLASPGVRIEAITTVFGNVDLSTATANIAEILTVAGASVPMIARGADGPLAGQRVDAAEVHGDDGLGGWTRRGRVSGPALDPLPAPVVITRLARHYPDQIDLLLIGPATNAAIARLLDPEGFALLRRIVIMGGAVFGPGNVTPAAEFNVFCDPWATRHVLDSGIPVVMVPLDATRKAVLTRKALEGALASRSDVRAAFLRTICGHVFRADRGALGEDGLFLHDPLAAALLVDTGLATATRNVGVAVETTPSEGWGRTTAVSSGAPATVVLESDLARFLPQLLDRVCQ